MKLSQLHESMPLDEALWSNEPERGAAAIETVPGTRRTGRDAYKNTGDELHRELSELYHSNMKKLEGEQPQEQGQSITTYDALIARQAADQAIEQFNAEHGHKTRNRDVIQKIIQGLQNWVEKMEIEAENVEEGGRIRKKREEIQSRKGIGGVMGRAGQLAKDVWNA